MKIEVKCAACGSNDFKLDGADNDDCAISCGECEHVIGTLGELKARLANQVVEQSRKRRLSIKAG